MRCLRALATVLALLVSAVPVCAAGTGWEIERNFRFFQYESDVALQRIAFDLAQASLKHRPSAEEMETFLNHPAFWLRAKLADADPSARDDWPMAWRDTGETTVFGLIRDLRKREPARAAMGDPAQLGRRGWASLLARPANTAHPDGWTDTCWDSGTRLHTNCRDKGDYVRPEGWIVRIYDTSASGADCVWSGTGGALVGDLSEAEYYARRKLKSVAWPAEKRDCREARVFVPSDDGKDHKVEGSIIVTRTAPGGATQKWALTPSDTLIVGFADSFGSGEGNPERGALFIANETLHGLGLPARRDDGAAPDNRAQWTDRWCHRSVYSWQIRSALYAALVDRHRSVTVLPYGCSGAEVFSGMLYTYDGVENVPRTTAPAGHSAQLGLAYQELCKSYYRDPRLGPAPPVATEPRWQTDANLLPFAGEGATARAGHRAEVVHYIEKSLALCEPRGLLAHAFKRDVDAVLLITGINDIGFRRWALAAVLPSQLANLSGGFIPQDGDRKSEALIARLHFRYDMLREALDRHFLLDAGLISALGAADATTLDRVVVPVYPRGLEDGRQRAGRAATLCDHGNEGMTVGVLTDSFFGGGARQCMMSGLTHGVVMAIRQPADLAAIEKFRADRLDGSAGSDDGLWKFVAPSHDRPGYGLIDDPDFPTARHGRFAGRGFCATTNNASMIGGVGTCTSFDEFPKIPPPSCFNVASGAEALADCLAKSAESLHVARLYDDRLAGSDPAWLNAYRPFGVEGTSGANWSTFAPYAHRTRLYRTPNDVYMLVDQRPRTWIDTNPPGPLDLQRAVGGAFHPTAEGHAIIATMAAARLISVLGLPP